MKTLTLFFFFLMSGTLAFSEGAGFTIEVSRSPLRYRVKLTSQSKSALEFDESAFVAPSKGHAPSEARILVRNASDELIYRGYQPELGYSSNDAISEINTKPKPKWRILKPGETWTSEWFLVDDLTRGLEQAATEVDRKRWESFKILFRVTMDSKKPAELSADSGWQAFKK